MANRYRWAQRFGRGLPVRADHWTGRRRFEAHDHDYAELVIITGGSGIHRSARGDLPLARGTALLLRPGTWHAYRDGRELALWDCCFDPGLLARELAWLADDPELGHLLWGGPLAGRAAGQVDLTLPEADLAEADRLLAGLHRLHGAAVGTARSAQIGLLIQLLALVARHQPGLARPTRPVHPAVTAAIALFAEAPDQPWTLAGLARRTGTTPTYLTRMFRAATGLPPIAYLHRQRCELAARLLLRSRQPIAAIAARVGWADPNHFARRFRDHFTMTASAYRQRFADLAGDA
jgi:AraC family L-rhamnose operon transcriptional activator RhaR